MRTLLAMVFLLCTALAATGCKAGCDGTCTCEEICARQNECAGADQRDCTVACADTKATTDTTKCNAQQDANRKCLSDGLERLCSDPNLCAAEYEAYRQCIKAFCTANPTSSICNI